MYIHVQVYRFLGFGVSGFGVLSSSVRHECDAAFALLKDRLEDTAEGGSGQSATCQKVGAVIGLGCAYAGTKRADVMESLTVLVVSLSYSTICLLGSYFR